jgi:PDZ domain-containing protein
VPPRHRRISRGWLAVTVVAGLLLVALVSSMFVYVPYYGLAPGDARPTLPLISSNDAQLFPADGQVLFTTVSVRRMTAFGAVVGWLDPDIDVLPERDVLGDQSPQENRTENLRVMGTSKEVAEYVALTRLGYDVGVSGGGAVITRVVEGVPAASVLARGDTIVAVDGRPVSLVSQLIEALGTHRPGDVVQLSLTDDDGTNPRTVDVELARREADGGPMIGVQLDQSAAVQFDFPVHLQIDTGRIGGPSAGLAFTLAALDALTPGELTGGKKVAVTGTILLDGAVGPIGGLRQKTVAVDLADAELFLVPSSEVQEALDRAPDDLEVIGVDSLDDALQALSDLGGNAATMEAPGAAAA